MVVLEVSSIPLVTSTFLLRQVLRKFTTLTEGGGKEVRLVCWDVLRSDKVIFR